MWVWLFNEKNKTNHTTMIKQMCLIAGALFAMQEITFGSTFDFDITGSAPGSTGFLGSNEANHSSSPATGMELNPGISYSDSGGLNLNFGWGSVPAAGGGIDLSGTLDGIYLQGPASLGGSGGYYYNLKANFGSAYTELKANGVSGTFNLNGFNFVDLPNAFGGSTPYTAQEQVDDFKAGHWYLNISSDFISGGEIRGQLTAVPEPEDYVMIAGIGLLAFAWHRRRNALRPVAFSS
jgi:hypothetical protein